MIVPILFALGCDNPDVHVNNLALDPDTINKGETLRVEGSIDSLEDITAVLVTVHDEQDAPLPESTGVTVASNAPSKDKISWDLRSDGDVRVVTSKSTPSGRYKVRVEGKTDAKNAIDVKFFTVR